MYSKPVAIDPDVANSTCTTINQQRQCTFWGPQKGRKVILWEGLSSEDQESYRVDLQEDENWVIWCIAKPKDIATQTFRTYGKCIFDGKRMKPKTDDNHEDFTGGKHVTRARSWWKRGDVSACAAQTNMQCWVPRGMLINTEQVQVYEQRGNMKTTRMR